MTSHLQHHVLDSARSATGAVVERASSSATALLRMSLGAVFLGFGVLKFFPGVSPAQDLAVTTTRLLTLGLVPDAAALVGVAVLECTIGVCLLVGGRLLRPALVLLVPQLAGILSPLVLLPHRLFAGPHHAPTLEGQYVLKDVILAAAVLVVAVAARRTVTTAAAASTAAAPRVVSTREKLDIVLAGLREECPLGELCATHGIDVSDYRAWELEVLEASAAIAAARAAAPAATTAA